MTNSLPQPNWHDAVLGQSAPGQSTDAVLGGDAADRSRPNWVWGNSAAAPAPARSLYGLLQQSLEVTAAAHGEIFCQLRSDMTFDPAGAAIAAPSHRAHARTTNHHQVALLWGFYDRHRLMTEADQTIWYNRFYFQRDPLHCLLRSLQSGFVYWQLGAAVKADWEYHFETAFGRCPIVPNSHHIMAHMAQFYPCAYQVAYRDWQSSAHLYVPPARRMPIQASAIAAVIELANYYLWFQMKF
jgi:hypothetical protein